MMDNLKYILGLAILGLFVGIGEASFADQEALLNEEQPTIHVIVHGSTWKTRGRIFYDIEGTIRKKLSLAGFQAIHDVKKPHHYQLVVQYDEERGAHYGAELWGTTINASFLFRGAGMEEPLSWKIREISTNTVSGPAPYLDAVLKLETHPHYFFLGSMLKRMTKDAGIQSAALTQAVKEFVWVVYPAIAEGVSLERGRIQDHFMEFSQRVYQEVALQRALDELIYQGIPDDTLAPIAERLLDSNDPQSRIRAVQILGRTQNAAFLEKIQKVATDDPIRAVRQAAQRFTPL
ncbi:MAG: HEAT repeat domain-containing protein [Nitrospirales bacterium]